jgi:TPP-dependent 2-oxoacid decarboxylase
MENDSGPRCAVATYLAARLRTLILDNRCYTVERAIHSPDATYQDVTT